MIYLAWAVLLVFQNAAFTWVSRARNSGSDWYHAFAAVFSNGIWFAATFITFERVWTVLKTGDVRLGVMIGAIYVAATVLGSVSMGMFLRKYVERGKRKVGHYDEPALDVKNSNAIRDLQRVVGNMAARQQSLFDGGLDRLWAERARSVPEEEVALFSPGLNMLHPDAQEYIRDREARARKYDRG